MRPQDTNGPHRDETGNPDVLAGVLEGEPPAPNEGSKAAAARRREATGSRRFVSGTLPVFAPDVDAIRESYARFVGLGRRTVEEAHRCGTLLIAAKAGTEHGRWLPLLEQCDVPQDIAHRVMRLAREYQIPQIAEFATVDEAIKALRPEPVPELTFDDYQDATDAEPYTPIPADEPEPRPRVAHNPVDPPPFPEGKYGVIYADPPWRYDFAETTTRQIENQYPTMDLDAISAMPVAAEIAADNAVLALWATAPKLPEALHVMAAWGFKYTTCAAWDKEVIGMGYWFRGQHELLLIGKRGTPSPPAPEARCSSVYRERRGEHSVKPMYFRDLLASWYPNMPKVELFARTPAPGWKSWGHHAS